ncbi:MAG: ABC transporter ATP-binding protein [Candidatus Dormibacteria bacterium]
MAEAVLEAERLSRRFRNGRGVGPVDLTIRAGEVVALVGPNGSGKTTLLRCLATRSTPQAGLVRWFRDADPKSARGQIGVVFDHTAHADELSARANLAFFTASKRVAGERSAPLLLEAELLEVADEPVSSYSYGMRRRLLLAEALAGEPRLLLLDEPTLGLDVAGKRWLTGVLNERSGSGLTACISTNDTEFVEQVATRVCFLVEGRVVHDAPVRDLLASLGGAREIRVKSKSALPLEAMRAVVGVERAVATEEGALVLAGSREGLLADLLATLGELDRTLLDLSVREPGLADCFLRITGRSLNA